MTAEQLGETVGGRYHSVLVNLSRQGRIQRRKPGRSHIYLSIDPRAATQQRQIIDVQSLPPAPLPAEIAVLVLVESIRHPNADCKQVARTIMQEHGVCVKTSQIEEFFDLHGLKKKMQTAASNPLDAMHENDAPALMSGVDSLSKIVLANVKIPTENAEHIISFLEKLRKEYGVPTAIVHDMGTGISKAVAAVFPGVPVFICHFHFLRDLGKDLLEPAYRQIRNRLRHHAISTRLNALARDARKSVKEQTTDSARLAESIQTAAVSGNPDGLPQAILYSLPLWILHGKHT